MSDAPHAVEERVRIAWKPEWEGAIVKAAQNITRRNLWRLEPEYGRDDVLGELRLVFTLMTKKYPAVTNPRHFMRLFITSATNRVHDMASKKTQNQPLHDAVRVITDERGSRDAVDMVGTRSADLDDVEFRMLLEDAPEDLRTLAVELVRMERGDTTRPVGAIIVARHLNVPRRTAEGLLARLAQFLTRELRPFPGGTAV